MLNRKLRRLLDRLLLVPALCLAIGPAQTAAAAIGGGDYFVSGSGDDVTGDGTEGNPWRTITHAVSEAGGGAPTIHVGEGSYNVLIGESFPIQIDAADDLGIEVVGPGDGSATVTASSILIKAGGGGVPLEFLKAESYISGEVIVSGLEIVGGSTGLAVRGFTPAFVLSLVDGAESVSILDNTVFNHGLLNYDYAGLGLDDQTILIENNIMVGGSEAGVALDCSFTSGVIASTLTVDFTARGNTFIGLTQEPLDMWFDISSVTGNYQLDILCEDNLMIGCGDDIEISASFGASSAELVADYTLTFRDNEIVNCDGGFSEYYFAEYTCTVNRTVEITNNTMSLTDGVGIRLSTDLDTSLIFDGDVLISGNNIQGGDGGIYVSFSVDYTGTVIDRDVVISNNSIRDVLNSGMVCYMTCYSSSRVGDHDFVIVGNDIRGCGDAGLRIYNYASYTATSSFDFAITNNRITDCDEAVEVDVSTYTGDYDYAFQFRGNVLQNQVSRLIDLEVGGSASLGLEFNWGDSAQGFNTISPQLIEDPSSTVNLSVSTSSVNATVSMVGNWWGTTDVLEIEDLVFHGVDSTGYAVADFSGPLTDDLGFTISQTGDKVKLTAGAGSGFVPYAGQKDIIVRVNGEAASNISVAADYLSLTFENDYAGEIEVCVTNPGGQSGCMTSTVTEVEEDGGGGGGGGGGCGIMPINGPPTAKDYAEQYFLFLLPVLFLLRRRLRGLRPVSAGCRTA